MEEFLRRRAVSEHAGQDAAETLEQPVYGRQEKRHQCGDFG
jgi:hypothetical protein